MKPRTVLSIDWDWVTGDCGRAAGHAHCGWCARYGEVPRRRPNDYRRSRGRGHTRKLDPERFERHGEAIVALLRRILKPGVGAYVSECHADLVRLVEPGDEVWSFDAHSDACDAGTLCCGSWECVATYCRAKVHNDTFDQVVDTFDSLSGRIKYNNERRARPESVELANSFRRPVNLVFLCRSGPFTPRPCDTHFYALCHSIKRRVPLCFFGYRADELEREFKEAT